MKVGKIIEELEKLGYNISDQDTDDRVWIDGIIIETMRIVTEDLVSKNESLHLVSDSSELTNLKEDRDQYKKLWQQSQRLKRELIKKYNLPIAEATLD